MEDRLLQAALREVQGQYLRELVGAYSERVRGRQGGPGTFRVWEPLERGRRVAGRATFDADRVAGILQNTRDIPCHDPEPRDNPPLGKVGSPAYYKAALLERTKKSCPYTLTFTKGEWSAIKSIRKSYQWAQDIFNADVVEERGSDGQVLVRMSTASGFALQESVENEQLALAGDTIVKKVLHLLDQLV